MTSSASTINDQTRVSLPVVVTLVSLAATAVGALGATWVSNAITATNNQNLEKMVAAQGDATNSRINALQLRMEERFSEVNRRLERVENKVDK